METRREEDREVEEPRFEDQVEGRNAVLAWKAPYSGVISVTANGNITVKYYYKKKSATLTVHHYIEGTENRVLLSNGEEAQDEEYEKRYGENYENLLRTFQRTPNYRGR